EATLDGTRKERMEFLVTVPLLILDDLGMRKLPLTAAEELLEIIMRRYERTSTILTSNRPVEDWGKLLGDTAAVSADGDGHALKNRILLGLPPKESSFILSKLTLVDLQLHDLLQEVGRPIEYGYFPNTAMGSVLNVMADGKSV